MTKRLRDDNFMRTERNHGAYRVAIPALVLLAASTMGGCMIYPDGKITTYFDEKTMKAELEKADREFGSTR